jgi:Oxygenase, catalysing oxidative methylation of damaged DNA
VIGAVRTALYPHLATIANEWNGRMAIPERYPATHASFLKRCHDAGQGRPTPLLLQYVPGDFNCLHQDLYGDLAFPIQVAILLSEPGQDFTGGEFVLTEQRPRMQNRAEVVPLRQGDAVAFAVHNRPVQGSKGNYRVNLRHGVSRVRSGMRHTVGIRRGLGHGGRGAPRIAALPRHPAGSVRQTRLRLNKQPPIDGQVTRNCSRSLEADCEDNVKSAIGGQCDEQVAQVGGALHAVVAQWVHVAQSPVGIPSAQGHLQQSGQRHRKRARFVEGQNNLALLAVLVLEGEAYRASVARDSAITFMHLPLPSIAVTRRLAKSLSYRASIVSSCRSR